MKRILSVILSINLILFLNLSAMAITQEECTSLVGSMGIIDTENYSGEKIVTREEFAEILSQITGLVNSNSSEKNFESLYAIKAVGKDESGLFRAEEPLTYDDAILGLLSVAGFGEISELSGGYPAGYEKIAMRYGLVCGKTGTESLTYDDLTTLIYKMLYLPVVETVYSNGKAEFKINTDDAVMTEIFDITEKSGILTACGDVNIYSVKELDDDMIALDGKEYRNAYAPISGMIGKYVTVFFRIENGERIAIFAYEGNRNSITVVESDADLEYNSSGRYYTYKENRKIKKINVKGASILYNGYIAENKEDMQFVPDNGWIEFIDNNADNRVDLVKIHGYTNYYVTGISQTDDGLKLYGDEVDAALIVNGENSGNTLLYNANGEELRIKQIKVGMLVSVFTYKEKGVLKAASLYASSGEIHGFLSGMDKEECELSIEGMTYKYDKTLQSEIDLLLLSTYRSFLLDYKGKIAYVNSEVADDNNKGVGYVIKTAETKGLKSGIDIKLYDSSGVMRILTAREKLIVDGISLTDEAAIKNALEGKTGMAAYTMYNDGRIRSIDFPADKDFSDNSTMNPLNHLLKAGGGSLRYRFRARVWGTTENAHMICNDGVRIIILPENPQTADDSDFAVKTELSDIFRDDGTYTVDCYSYNNNGIGVDYIVYTRPNTWMETVADLYVVKNIKYTRNEDGNFVPSLQLTGLNGTVTYNCSDESVMNNVTTFTGVSSSNIPGDPCEKPEKGDAIKIALNMKNEITDIRMIYDYDNDSFTPVSATSYFSASHIIKGRVYDKANDVMLVTTRPDVTNMTGAVSKDFEAYKMSLFKIIKFDSVNDEISTVTSDAVKAYMKNNGEYSEVITSIKAGTPSIMIIYE